MKRTPRWYGFAMQTSAFSLPRSYKVVTYMQKYLATVILEKLYKQHLLYRLPSHTSHKAEPCDVAVFSPLEAAH
jgi:hypothetical protein